MQDTPSLTDPSAERVAATERPAESSRRSLVPDIRFAGRLIGRYVRSDPVMALLLVAVIIGSGGVATYLSMQMYVSLAAITNALAAKNAAALGGLSSTVVLFGLLTLALGLLTLWANLTLRIRLRRHMVEKLLGRWIGGYKFFQLEQRCDLDYPEQRIQEDTYLFVDRLMLIGPTMIILAFSIVLYSGQLWRLSPPLTIETIGMTQPIPGFLVFVAIGFGVIFTLLTHWVGASLTRVEVVRQRLEAQFRHEMTAIRLNGESIAFARAAGLERTRLAQTFDLIRKNWRYYTWSNMKLNFVAGFPEIAMRLAPTLLCAPFVLSRQMQIGDIALVGMSFAQVYMGVSILALYYGQLALMRSSVARLRLLDELLSVTIASDIKVSDTEGRDIQVRRLTIAYPDGSAMTEVGDLRIAPGDRLLVQGRSGAGKSTLLRSIAGLWPFGGGEVVLPRDAKIAFLPQRGYMPDGTLGSLMAYPRTADAFSDETYAELLTHFGLARLIPRLHDFEPWSRILSPGEQQRISAARAILTAPDFLFVDEATSALDETSEANLYALVAQRLPHAALISVAHRPAVERYHDTVLKLEDGKTRLTKLATATA